MTQNYTTVVGESASTAAARAEIKRLTKERDVLRAAIFGGGNYDPDLRNGNFVEMAQELHAAQKGGLERAEKAEAERDEALTQVAAAYEAAAQARVLMAEEGGLLTRVPLLPETKAAIRALAPAAAKAAIEAYGREKVREGMQRAAGLVSHSAYGTAYWAILADMEKLK